MYIVVEPNKTCNEVAELYTVSLTERTDTKEESNYFYHMLLPELSIIKRIGFYKLPTPVRDADVV